MSQKNREDARRAYFRPGRSRRRNQESGDRAFRSQPIIIPPSYKVQPFTAYFVLDQHDQVQTIMFDEARMKGDESYQSLVEQQLAEIDRIRDTMRRTDDDIQRLKSETRAILAELDAYVA